MKGTLERPHLVRGPSVSRGIPVRRGSLKSLAEAIILQSMEDLWSSAHREESVAFFKGEGFRTCAEMAGMGPEEQQKVLGMIAGSVL